MEPETPPTPTFFERFKKSFLSTLSLISANVLAPIGALILVVVTFLLVTMGFKELQIGGALGRLLGRKPAEEGDLDVANSVPSDRIGPNGELIPAGTPDSKGDTQAMIVPIEEPGMFSNPDEISFTPPGEDKPTDIGLPDGVKNKDVEQVIVVQPEVIAVTVKDNSGVPAADVDDLLKKYELCAHS